MKDGKINLSKGGNQRGGGMETYLIVATTIVAKLS